MVKLRWLKEYKGEKVGDVFESSKKSAENFVSQGYAEYVRDERERELIDLTQNYEFPNIEIDVNELTEEIKRQLNSKILSLKTGEEKELYKQSIVFINGHGDYPNKKWVESWVRRSFKKTELSLEEVQKKVSYLSTLKPLEQKLEIKYLVENSKFNEADIRRELKEYIKKRKEDYEEIEEKENPYEMFGKIGAVRIFLKEQPLFYDKSNIWWLWNKQKLFWEISDETDILNQIRKANHDTVNSKERTEILNALKQVGRENAPKEIVENWIQFKDKIIDLDTGEIFNADSKYFITNPIPWKIGESEDTPTMDKYFKEWVFHPGLQDESYVQTLYEILTYSAMSKQFLQRLFAFVGSGSNGKGVFLSIIKKFLGERNCCTTELKVLANNNFEASALYKKQACFMGEVDAYDMKNTNLIKKLSGEDDIRYEFKGKTPFTEKSSTTCFMNTNSLPVTPDKSKGFYRRFLIIDFPHEFKVGKDILSEIPEVEFENLAKKCIRLAKELLSKKSFTNEGSIEDRIKKYEDRSNPLLTFIENSCEEDFESYISLNLFMRKFSEYLKDNRLRTIDKKKVKNGLVAEGFEVTRTTKDTIRDFYIIGLKLKEKPDKSEDTNKSEILDKIKDLESKDESFLVNQENLDLFNLTEKELKDILYELSEEGLIYEAKPNLWRYLG